MGAVLFAASLSVLVTLATLVLSPEEWDRR
jgi:hypothetical protein